MFNYLKNIILILLLFLVLGVEQTLGLPSIFIVSALFLVQIRQGYEQLLWLIFIGLMLSIFYELPLAMMVAGMIWLQLIILLLKAKINSEGLRVLIASGVLLLLFWGKFAVSLSLSLYLLFFHNLIVLGTVLLLLFIFRRRRKTLGISKRVS